MRKKTTECALCAIGKGPRNAGQCAKTKTREFRQLCGKLKMNPTKAAMQLCRMSKRTAYRWKRQGAPPWALKLMAVYLRHDIEEPGWYGWAFIRGALQHGKTRFRPENLLHYKASMERLTQLEAKALRAEKTTIQECIKRGLSRIRDGLRTTAGFPTCR